MKVAQWAMIMRADNLKRSAIPPVLCFKEKMYSNPNFITRSGDEMDQVAHGRWGRNEGSDVSDAPISEESESESLSNSRSEESRTPSRSPTPLRDPEERSQSQGSFADGIELVAGNDEKVNVVPIEDPRDKLPPYLPSVYGCRSVEEFQVSSCLEIKCSITDLDHIITIMGI